MIEEIFKFLILVIAYYILTLCYGLLVNKSLKKDYKNYVIIMIITLVNMYAANGINHVLKLLLSVSTFFIIGYSLYKENLKKSLILMLSIFIIIMISEIIIMIPITILVKNVQYYVNSLSILKAMMTLSTALTAYMILSVKKVCNFISTIIKLLDLKSNKIYSPIVIETILSILLITYIDNFTNHSNIALTATFSVLCLFIIVFTIYLIYSNNRLKSINEYLLNNEKNYQELFQINKEFRHNIVHELNCIRMYGNDKVKELVDSYIDEHRMNTYKMVDTFKIPSGLQGILYQKLILKNALNLNVQVDNYFKTEPLSKLGTMTTVKLSESFGIIIDNAIEELDKVNIDEKFLYIYFKEEKDKYVIRVSNPINSEINIDDIIGKSTKSNHMGVGLNYIKSKTKFNTKTEIINNIFRVTLKIKK